MTCRILNLLRYQLSCPAKPVLSCLQAQMQCIKDAFISKKQSFLGVSCEETPDPAIPLLMAWHCGLLCLKLRISRPQRRSRDLQAVILAPRHLSQQLVNVLKGMSEPYAWLAA